MNNAGCVRYGFVYSTPGVCRGLLSSRTLLGVLYAFDVGVELCLSAVYGCGRPRIKDGQKLYLRLFYVSIGRWYITNIKTKSHHSFNTLSRKLK